ncbi:MAG: asparagine synthase-related protein [Actinomycetota bacterium]|nr:asparagine synthase-related protein [Actinomycetota bacterium]
MARSTGDRSREPGFPTTATEAGGQREDPLPALEHVLLGHLSRPPCFVAFSGGRDSSLVLAAATRAARRESLPPPVPITSRYPHVAETDESAWQEQVIRQLHLPDWIKLTAGPELDLLGPIAQSSLRTHGLVWPPTIHTARPRFEATRGGSLLTGNGGDEVFGPQRSAPLAALRAGRRQRRVWKAALTAVAPRTILRRRMHNRLAAEQRPWLRPQATRALTESLLHDGLREPLRWDRAVRLVSSRRSWVMGKHNYDVLARQFNVRYVHPLLEPRFVAAVAHRGGPVGFMNRTEAMRVMFSGLLPPGVLERETKAFIEGDAANAYTRAFIETWDGSGIDSDLVDGEALRTCWRQSPPPVGTFMLLQAAWLACDHNANHVGSP